MQSKAIYKEKREENPISHYLTNSDPFYLNVSAWAKIQAFFTKMGVDIVVFFDMLGQKIKQFFDQLLPADLKAKILAALKQFGDKVITLSSYVHRLLSGSYVKGSHFNLSWPSQLTQNLLDFPD